MIVTSVQIKTVKTQKHLYCPVFTEIDKFRQRLVDFTFSLLTLHETCQEFRTDRREKN